MKIDSLAVPGVSPILLQPGYNTAVHLPGIDAFEGVRADSELTLRFDDGTVVEVTVHSSQVGTLYDTLTTWGPQSIYNEGRNYAPVTVIQRLGDAYANPVVDMTKIWSVLIVSSKQEPNRASVQTI